MNEEIKREKTENFATKHHKNGKACINGQTACDRPAFSEKLSTCDIVNKLLKVGVKEVLVLDHKGAALFKEKIN